MSTKLGINQYGKAETRLVRIYRGAATHEIRDLNVSTTLRGDFELAHTIGDQTMILPTDSQKNTAYAYAKIRGVTSIEDYAIGLGERLLEATAAARQVQVRVHEYGWVRVGDHSFVRQGGGVRTCLVTITKGVDGTPSETQVISGIENLVILNSTDSEFKGFLRDEFTTLPEADDRILATSLVAKWRHTGTTVDWNKSHAAAVATLIEAFAGTYSRALQETLYVMGAALLEAQDELAEVRFSAPNKHHFLVDFAPFAVDGLTNEGEVFVAADRPYGLIEAQVVREGAPPAGDAWLAEPGFC